MTTLGHKEPVVQEGHSRTEKNSTGMYFSEIESWLSITSKICETGKVSQYHLLGRQL